MISSIRREQHLRAAYSLANVFREQRLARLQHDFAPLRAYARMKNMHAIRKSSTRL
jgi:hypothetical protein